MPSRAVQCDGFLTMTGGEGCDVGPPNIGTWGITDILVGGPEGFAVRVEDSRTVIADPEIDREEADTGSGNPLDEFAGVLVERADPHRQELVGRRLHPGDAQRVRSVHFHRRHLRRDAVTGIDDELAAENRRAARYIDIEDQRLRKGKPVRGRAGRHRRHEVASVKLHLRRCRVREGRDGPARLVGARCVFIRRDRQRRVGEVWRIAEVVGHRGDPDCITAGIGTIGRAWFNRMVLLSDLVLIWWLWGKILRRRANYSKARSWRLRLLQMSKAVLAILCVMLFACVIATIPGERQENHLLYLAASKSLRERIFAGPIDETTRRRTSLFSNTLVLPGFNIYEALKIDDPKKVEWKEHLVDLRGRDLRDAVFDGAVLKRADFTGAQFRRASLFNAQLQGANFTRAQLQEANLAYAHLQGANLDSAELQGARLNSAELQGALFFLAHLEGSFFMGAQLQGAFLNNAKLQGSDLQYAQLLAGR